jgi:acyl dehydratase
MLRGGSFGAKGTAMAERIEITEEMRAQIGKESQPWTYEVTTTSVRAFARGVGYTDPVYYDVDAARKAGYRSLPAPPTYLGTPVFLPGKSSDTFSGPAEGIPRIRHGLSGLLDGGTETEYFETICAGDTLTAVQRVADLEVRDSRTLGKMLVVTSETTYTNQHGALVAKQRSQAIFY